MKAKAKVKFEVKCLCERECEGSSVLININTKAKAIKYCWWNSFYFNVGGNGIRGLNIALRSSPLPKHYFRLIVGTLETGRARKDRRDILVP